MFSSRKTHRTFLSNSAVGMFVMLLVAVGAAGLTGCEEQKPLATTGASAAPTAVAEGKPGLLLVAHGAPWPKWNAPLLDLEKQVQQAFGEGENPFGEIKLVFMEFAEPTVADGVKAMETAGCGRIVVVPLLIAPSSHSHWDVPALLGLYADPQMQEALREEGATPVRSRLPITLTPTFDYGGLLEDVLLRRVKELSRNPAEEAVIVLAHGDEGLMPIWDARMRRLLTHLCGKTGIDCGDYAFVHVGQSYETHGVSAIASAAERKKRVLLVGCYVGMGAIGMHHRYMHTPEDPKMPMPNPLKGKEIVCSKQGLLPDPAVAEWVKQRALDALK